MEIDARVFYPEPPAYADLAPTLAVYVGDADGRCEVFAWDAAAGERRRLTNRPQGTVTCAIDPYGRDVWWFDGDLAGVGEWRIQPFAGGPARPSGFPAGRAAGLAMALDGAVAAGVGDERGFAAYVAQPGEAPREVARVGGYAHLVDMSGSGGLIALAGEPEGPEAVTVLDLRTGDRTILRGTRGALWPAGFAPGGRSELLLLTVRPPDGRYRLATWTADRGLRVEWWCAFDTEISPSWFPDERRVLVRQERHGRTLLHAVDLVASECTLLSTPDGSILAATVQPDGDLQYVWTDGVHPPRLCSTAGSPPPVAAPDAPQPGRRDEVWVPTPSGPVHTLLTLPDAPGPYPAVFLLHGGPHDAARDAYDPLVSVFVGIGCAVVRPNYRGSSGYGAEWRGDFDEGVGLTQLLDLAAVRAHLVDAGLVDPDRTAVCGESWGGYLALLAAGVQPDSWHAVAAVNPIADYPAAFRDATPAVRALDVRLFGGTPQELPAAYVRSSPATYAAGVQAPVLIVASTDDAKCPPAQIRDYAAALRRHGRRPELEWMRSGHDRHRAELHAHTIGTVVRFVATALGGRPVPAGAAASATAGAG